MRPLLALRLAVASAVVLLALAGAAPAAADWSEQPALVEAIYGGNVQITQGSIVRDADGDFFLLFGGYFPCIAQRVGADGVAQWPFYTRPSNGGDAMGDLPLTHVIAPDGAGGAYHFGDEASSGSSGRSEAVTHLNAAGTPDWGTDPMMGTVLAPGGGLSGAHDVMGDAGGAWVAFFSGSGLRVQRLVGGVPAPGWSPAGHAVGTASTTPALASDGTGGAFVFWTDASSARVTHLLADSTTAPPWTTAGTWLGAANWSGIPNIAGSRPALVPSGGDGFIAAWMPDLQYGGVLLQRFRIDGSVDPAWPAGGRGVGPASYSYDTGHQNEVGAHAVSDGLGGVHVTWRDSASVMPRWAHVLANGTFAPGHSAAGISPLPAGAVFDINHQSAAAATDGGGLVFAWLDSRNANHKSLRVAWRRADGTPDPSEPDTGRVVPIPTGADDPYLLLGMESDHVGGAWVMWRTWAGPGPYNEFIWMNHMARSGSVLDAPPVHLAAPLALSTPYPNPARSHLDVRFTLPDERAATLALYDVSGRLARRTAVQGAGSRTASFDHLESLAPGVYLLRLSHGGAQRSERIAIVR